MRTSLTLFFTLMLGVNLAYAETVTLYQEPKADSKTVATVDLAKGIVPIYTPDGSDWIKVADPSNGNVGWMKQSDFKNANSASIKINQQTGPDGKVQSSGVNLHVGKPIDMNDPKVKANLEEIRKLQDNVQRNMKTQIQDMVNGMNNLYQKQMKLLEDSGYYVPPMKKTPATDAKPTPAPITNTATP